MALEQTFDAHYDIGLDLDVAYRLLTDLGHMREIRVAAGDTPLEVGVTAEGDVTVIRVVCNARSGFPGFIDKLLSKALRIELIMRWTRGVQQSLSYIAKIGTKGHIEITGSARLCPGTDRFSADAAYRVRVDYPVFKKAILQFAAEKARTSMAEDFLYVERVIAPRHVTT